MTTRIGSTRPFLLLGIIALIGLLTSVFTSLAQDKPKGVKEFPPEKKVMMDKLKNAQLLLEAMALGDFAKIQKCSDELMALSKKAEWFIVKTDKYQSFSNEFRRALETLSQKAKDKNLDGATLTYVDLTMTCMKCHKYFRDERETSLPLTGTTIGTLYP